ncbi:MAG: HDIG domain-containing protein [Candidatus Delongbacteria bacterium]|nr:HDIG domain-containing protein [Candidatus Delongbacteria bacterium]
MKIYIVFLFVLVYGFIVYMYPRERKFAYEFQQGAPWPHEDLIANYNFPVYKSPETIANEKDSVYNNFIPYFKYDSIILDETKSDFRNAFFKAWIQVVIPGNNSFPGFKINNNQSSTIPKKQRDKLLNDYFHIFDSIYQTGLIKDDSLGTNTDEIRILENGEAQLTSKTDVLFYNEACNILKQRGKSITKEVMSDSLVDQLTTRINLCEFLVPNLTYAKNTNEKILAERINNISRTRGMIQKGELIIQQGGIVDGETYLVLQSMKKDYESSANITRLGLLIFGISLLYIALGLALFLFLRNFKPEILVSFKKITFVMLQVFILMIITIVIVRFTGLSVYIVPFALVPMVINTFYDSRTALFLHLIIVLMAGFLAPNGFEFVLLQMFAGIVAVFSLSNIQKRKQLFVTSFYVLLIYCITYFALQMLYGRGLNHLIWTDFAWFAGNAALLLFVLPLIYAYEKLFGFVSDVTLMELSDTNNPLLRQLAEKAPGTFQHSIQVGNLTEAVAREIGGNPMLVRTGALYHDIGKSATPQYFMENISGKNPHDKLDHKESARLIIAHVTNGKKMARKAKLPDQIIDFIVSHHGTTRAEYFYRSFQNDYPDKKIDSQAFTYPGPMPHNIETAILMMADTVEAATRSLNDYSEKNIRNMVNTLIDKQREANQFENVDITFKMINKAKRVFTDKLLSIYHTRIEYPDEKNKHNA